MKNDKKPILEKLEMAKAKMPHPSHNKHLCYLTNMNFHLANPKEYKVLLKDAKFMCRVCGRAAASDSNLCKPVKI